VNVVIKILRPMRQMLLFARSNARFAPTALILVSAVFAQIAAVIFHKGPFAQKQN
jgi:hypothetical protein